MDLAQEMEPHLRHLGGSIEQSFSFGEHVEKRRAGGEIDLPDDCIFQPDSTKTAGSAGPGWHLAVLERARDVGSLESLVQPEAMRPYLIGELRRGRE